ncbi:MAG: hypothetical protein IKJ33_05000 [Clostridia bacterium]|nr:hypothetical protein [Clostridia bacterium]
MKHFKRIICLLLMFVTMSVFVACSKGETPPPQTSTPPPPVEGNGGPNVEDNNNNDNENNNEDNNTEEEEDEPQEVYVPYTSSEIMMVGSTFVGDFFNGVQANLEDENLFDDNLSEMKNLFLNTSKMIKTIAEIENLPYGYCVNGKAVILDEYEGKTNKVERFYATFSPDDEGGYSSVKLRIAFSYNGLDSAYDYVYYDIFIQTNKAQNKVLCEISAEFSMKDGADSSKAKYYNIDLNGTIGGGNSCEDYNCYQLDRTNNNFESINYNNINNLKQSECVKGSKTYVGGDDAENLLRSSNSKQSVLVKDVVSLLNQGYNMLFRGNSMATLTGLSESLIIYVNVQNKII